MKNISKDAIMQVIGDVVTKTVAESDEIKKKLHKGDLTLKQYTNQYIEKRKEFHRYSLLRSKVKDTHVG